MKMNNSLRLIALLTIAFFNTWNSDAQDYNPIQRMDVYNVEVNIKGRLDNMVDVTVVPPIMDESEVVYAMPKIIPGTYDISDFGQFVRGFKAYDSKGAELEVHRLDENKWKISKGKSLYKITYSVVETDGDQKANIFLPGGTSIAENGVLLNNFGFVGFMLNREDVTYRYEVVHDKDLIGSTALDVEYIDSERDVYLAKDYFELHDRPVLYSPSPSATTFVAGAELTVGVYSPEGHLNADAFLEGLKPVFESAANYLGGTLPTDRYVVLVWGMTRREVFSNGSVGALEHFTSTTVTMPDLSGSDYAMFGETGEHPQLNYLRSIVAHEFFHIVTPLNIHSEQIHDYDFVNPQMSEHLWFYEGLTEYNSLISQVRGGVITEEYFMEQMVEKMHNAEMYNEYIPMTLRSKHALDVFASQYGDVYEKGALIGMALDMYLRENSKGKEGLVDLMLKLKDQYGPDTFFVDDQFFDIIADLTPEGTLDFLYEHIAGTAPLPFEHLFEIMGYNYKPVKLNFNIQIPSWGLSYISSVAKNYTITYAGDNDDFTQAFGVQKGDELLKWNGEKVKGGEWSDVLNEWANEARSGDEVVIEVLRKNDRGESDKIELKSIVTFAVSEEHHLLSIKDNPSEEQLALKDAWLKSTQTN